MLRRLLLPLLVLTLFAPAAAAEVNAVTPSTNEANADLGWAHFVVDDVRIGEVDITFVSTRGFFSCFEYRSDGAPTDDPRDNFNPDVTDGLWDFTCIRNTTTSLTLEADEYVEIRMVFGAERDERFDWTRVDVLPDARTADDCRDGGWADYGFRNQGQCIRFVNTGKDSRG